MSSDYENQEIVKFLNGVQQDVRSSQLSDEEGGNLEQIFTQYAIDLLAEAGETENARVAYDEKALGTKNQHKVNGYSISDNYENIDVFITIFKGSTDLSRIDKGEIETACKRVLNFVRKGIYNDYVNEIEESSAIFDFVHTLGKSNELKENLVRINVIILSDGYFTGENPKTETISGYPFYFRVIDINYLYNITEKSHIPIEIDFKEDGFEVPCILSPSANSQYQSYLAIIPGIALASIYEKFGSRLLEQNVRSFLQFAGKINKGIRNTILKEPNMFLAFNNGLAATADDIELVKSEDGKGFFISKVKDFQIVNGGQTTASIYHTLKKDKADISGIFVQLKLNVVKNKDDFSSIVSRISEYANTQNKVSISDLSSNRPFHIELEKLSRSLWAPPIDGQSTQTHWFYERARGQYKNARVKEGFTKAKQKQFDIKNPKNQVFTKEDLAKYINTYEEIIDGKKILIGPHYVVRGNQKNYVQFINYNLEKKIDNIYFEDTIAKAILIRSAEKIYGVKPNSIGDMRYITVPYSIAYLAKLTNHKLDLFKIWKAQAISESLSKVLYSLMTQVESYIKSNAPGALYGEWAKKEECWNSVKEYSFDLDIKDIKEDLINTKKPDQRRKISNEETELEAIEQKLERIKSVPSKIWHKIENWGRDTESLRPQQLTIAFDMAGRVRVGSKISDYEREAASDIIDLVIEKAPEILFEIDNLPTETEAKKQLDMTMDLVKSIVAWDKKNKKLRNFEFVFMHELSIGKQPFTELNKKKATWNYIKVKKAGFVE
jgi:hypothetical protein